MLATIATQPVLTASKRGVLPNLLRASTLDRKFSNSLKRFARAVIWDDTELILQYINCPAAQPPSTELSRVITPPKPCSAKCGFDSFILQISMATKCSTNGPNKSFSVKPSNFETQPLLSMASKNHAAQLGTFNHQTSTACRHTHLINFNLIWAN